MAEPEAEREQEEAELEQQMWQEANVLAGELLALLEGKDFVVAATAMNVAHGIFLEHELGTWAAEKFTAMMWEITTAASTEQHSRSTNDWTKDN